jgi:hypothetical protein
VLQRHRLRRPLQVDGRPQRKFLSTVSSWERSDPVQRQQLFATTPVVFQFSAMQHRLFLDQ